MDVRDRIRSYIGAKVAQPLEDDDDIFELGLVDSLFGLQLVSFVEQEFGMEVDGDDLDIDNFCSIAAINRFVVGKMGAGFAQ
ncbi:acyl carrier protein [Sphingomonas sp. DG1-23]|uniref:acyl carrier protein n=1 Tax=Sphingomonas sp. DG1-23 TaxID=3068316 RepID=UPI0027400570|nr:acyl carrier protein [Sphingomonas sp. DG1-23]MDP5278767.1 acyl carrier protein [Sphingomonas sp. DG1-23]